MVGMLKGKLYVVGIEENIIKAKNPNEKDSAWYRLTLSDGVSSFTCTCGSSWKVKEKDGVEVEYNINSLKLMSLFDMSFNPDMSSGYCKLKLKTFKAIKEMPNK